MYTTVFIPPASSSHLLEWRQLRTLAIKSDLARHSDLHLERSRRAIDCHSCLDGSEACARSSSLDRCNTMPDEQHEELPPDLARERDAVIAQIYEAFADVTREGGVSWSETEVLDLEWGGTEAELAAARLRDRDKSWVDLINDAGWHDETSCGGFAFLDAIGYRYYSAAAMVRHLRNGESSCDLLRSLTVDRSRDRGRKARRGQWSSIDEPQSRCIARFIRFWIVMHTAEEDDGGAETWEHALASHWHKFG